MAPTGRPGTGPYSVVDKDARRRASTHTMGHGFWLRLPDFVREAAMHVRVQDEFSMLDINDVLSAMLANDDADAVLWIDLNRAAFGRAMWTQFGSERRASLNGLPSTVYLQEREEEEWF